MDSALSIASATIDDVPVILDFVRKLADFEKLGHEVQAGEQMLREHLFGPKPAAEVLLARWAGQEVGFALFFQTFSTFMGRPGIWLEDLFVLPEHRHKGIGQELLKRVANIAVRRNCGRLEWSVLDWNEPAISVYKKIGATAMSDWTIQRLTGQNLLKLAGSEIKSQ